MTEELNRAAKAMKLLMALQAEAKERGFDVTTKNGALALAMLAGDMPGYAWARLARKARVTIPSEKTTAMVATLLTAQADVIVTAGLPASKSTEATRLLHLVVKS